MSFVIKLKSNNYKMVIFFSLCLLCIYVFENIIPFMHDVHIVIQQYYDTNCTSDSYIAIYFLILYFDLVPITN